MTIFTANTPQKRSAIVRYLENRIKAPYVHVQVSTLGGEARASAMVSVSLDPKSSWNNGIFQNSRYFQLSIDRDGTVEQFSIAPRLRTKKLRRARVAGMAEAVAKINKYIGMIK